MTTLPNLFVIGVPKAGTTLLHNALGKAPDVFMSQVKEPGFFSSDRHYAEGLERYRRAYFGAADGYRVIGESTPWYFYSSVARERLHADIPQARFLVVLRKPADRAWSMYRDQVAAGLEVRSFEDAVRQDLRSDPGGDPRRRYASTGKYDLDLVTWLELFGAGSVKVLFFEEMIRNAASTWEDLGQWLGQELGPEQLTSASARQRNAASEARSPRLQAFLRGLEGKENTLVRTLKRWEPPGLHRKLVQQISAMNRRIGSEQVVPPTEVLSRLDELFLPHVKRLEELLQRDLDMWRLPRQV